jgi:ribosomal-protein-alanine N-acetyltransferase
MSTTTFEIRDLGYPDIPAVVALERRAYTSPWSMSMFTLELSKPSSICLAAVNGPALYGYLICSRYDEAYHVMNIAVDGDHRRQGIAQAMFDNLFHRAGHDANYTLEVRVSNAGAIKLYESYGFRAVGTRKRYYIDNGEDAIIMWRAVGTPWEAR